MHVQIELKRLWVRNFKSLRDFSLDVPTRFNVIIGTNGSGKTALTEVFELWRDLLEYGKGRVVNPFLKWWGYDRVVWRHDERLNIALGLELANPESKQHISYEVQVSGIGGTLHIVDEVLETEKEGIQLRYDMINRRLYVKVDANSLIDPQTLHKLASHVYTSLRDYMFRTFLYRKLRPKALSSKLGEVEFKTKNVTFEVPVETSLIKEEADNLFIVTRIMDNPENIYNSITKFERNIVLKPETSLIDEKVEIKVKREIASLLAVHTILNSISILKNAWSTVVKFIEGIVVIKELDLRAVKSPQRLERQERLLPDASNFVPFLFTLTGGRLPPVFEEAVRYALPGAAECRLGFEVTTDGRVFLKLSTDGVSLPSVAIPSGVLKTLIIEAALYAKPTVVVIDEFENSLHPELQQFLMDELRNGGAYVFIATHSTVLLDYVKSPKEVVILRLENGETRAYRLKEETKEKLKKYGLTLSELVLSGLLEPAG